MKSVIAAYVENKYGVIARITGLFLRKGFNIDSVTCGETEDPRYSRVTIALNGDDFVSNQLINQLKKLYNVKKVKLLKAESSVECELMLIKVKDTEQNRNEVKTATEIYKTKIIDCTTETMCVEVTGKPNEIDAFIELMRPLGIIEMCRTGVVALERGNKTIEN